MCGIVGFHNLDGSPVEQASGRYLASMCRSITHRGPDEDGSVLIGPVALGMTRLSIIDLKTGQQPIYNEDSSICIVFNGEIYNFEELRRDLLQKGHRFRTKSDTETIVHLYEEHGIDCLQYLEGMFAFAIWDKNKDRLFIARDRMGEKPLHWAIFDNVLIFGSELKTIFEHPAARRSPNMEALRQYLALEYVPAPNTLFENIYKLLPAHYMVIENGQVNIASYWSPSQKVEDYGSEEEVKERMRELLDRSIELRLISDVPLGVFLSGGIDSSTIAALATKHVQNDLKTFSIGFADKSFDESDHARVVAEHLGTSHRVMQFQPDIAFSTLSELWEVIDEPIADASIVPTFLLSKMTRESVTVALAGEGGDELFGGYPTYLAHRMAAYWNAVPAPLRQGVLEPLIRALPVSHNNLSFDYKLKRFIASCSHEPVARQLRWMGGLPMDMHGELLEPEVMEASSSMEDEFDLIAHIDTDRLYRNLKKDDVADQIMRLDQLTYLPDDLLVKSDRATMAASLEARLPFLAYPLVEFAQSLPTSLKIRGTNTKYLLRKLAADLLPASIVKRPKKGFGIPVAKWLRADFKHLVDRLLTADYLDRQGIFQIATVERLRDEHLSGRIDRRKELWTLLMFQLWWTKYFDGGLDLGIGLETGSEKRIRDSVQEKMLETTIS